MFIKQMLLLLTIYILFLDHTSFDRSQVVSPLGHTNAPAFKSPAAEPRAVSASRKCAPVATKLQAFKAAIKLSSTKKRNHRLVGSPPGLSTVWLYLRLINAFINRLLTVLAKINSLLCKDWKADLQNSDETSGFKSMNTATAPPDIWSLPAVPLDTFASGPPFPSLALWPCGKSLAC